ncbi:MAG: DUF4296 domain-containing protein [Muribaculaceae bacterium]|nr:DUF4296 domain-containing protein [Muribaculaceae bacterium]
MKRIAFSALASGALLLVSGCNGRPDGVLSHKKMVEVMTDMQIAEAYSRSQYAPQDMRENTEALGDGVLAAHSVTREELDSTLSWYGRNLDEYDKMCREVDVMLLKRQKELVKAAGASKPDVAMESDMWAYPRHFLLTERDLADQISFSIPVAEIAPGDRVEWMMRPQNGQSLSVMLGVEYDDRTAQYTFTTVQGRPNRNVPVLQTDTGRQAVRLFGIARPVGGRPVILRVDSVALRSLPYDSVEYARAGRRRFIKL